MMVQGNQIADAAAARHMKEAPNDNATRNHAKNPSAGTDNIYITAAEDSKGPPQHIDGPIGKWIRRDTQDRIMDKRICEAAKGKGERPFYLLLLDKIDRKRTFRNAATKLAKQHAVHKTLFMVRMHAMQTMKKDNLRVKAAKKGDIKNYLLAMYPDNKCHAHKKESEQKHRQRMQGQVEAEYEDVFTDDPTLSLTSQLKTQATC